MRTRPSLHRQRYSPPPRGVAPPDTITVDVIVYDGFNALEAMGVSNVFAYANSHLERRGLRGRYDVKIAAANRGYVVSDAGVAIVTEKRLDPLAIPHTALVVGGRAIEDCVAKNAGIVEWVRHAGTRGSRIAGLCIGTFLVAEAGLLNGKRATTHWSLTELLKNRHPEVSVCAGYLFVRDGSVWTSAGVTAGIDLALAIVEMDFGDDVAAGVEKDLVIHARRTGSQSQLRLHSASRTMRHPDIRAVQHWILDNIDKTLTAADMAQHAATSLRSFNRRFKEETGTTPTAFLSNARVDAARRLLEESDLPAKTIASRTGFKTYEAMRKAFHDTLGITPIAYREHATRAAQDETTES